MTFVPGSSLQAFSFSFFVTIALFDQEGLRIPGNGKIELYEFYSYNCLIFFNSNEVGLKIK